MENMTLLIDTSVLIELEHENEQTLSKLGSISREHPERAAISFITYAEFLTGLEKEPLQRKAEAKKFLWKFRILHTTNETALWLAHLRSNYRKQQKSLSDLFIASQAIEHKLTLVTLDKDFEDIKEIKKIIL